MRWGLVILDSLALAPRLASAGLLLVAGFSFASLLLGAPYLSTSLPGGLPTGNALAWVGLSSAASAAVLLSPRGKLLHSASIAILIGSAAWLPVSVALAGNLALNFSGQRGVIWIAGSLTLLIAVLCVLSLAVARAFVTRRRQAG